MGGFDGSKRVRDRMRGALKAGDARTGAEFENEKRRLPDF